MNTKTLTNDFLTLAYCTDALRITGLTPKGKKNIFADLSHLPPIATEYGDFYFHGGHRLWHSPESMPRTYIPDSGEIKITDLLNGITLEAPTEPLTGIRKRMDIQLASDTPSVIITHTLTNDGAWTVELAPWAITQFRHGGTVVLPLPTEKADPAGLLPNRQISFWHYARITDPRLTLRDGLSFFEATAAAPFKMGYFSTDGWLAYRLDGIIFKKTFGAQIGANYPDNNCNAEIYCNEDFVELESLAPLTQLAPAESVTHTEKWDLLNDLDAFHSLP